jgi:hypothetical protein
MPRPNAVVRGLFPVMAGLVPAIPRQRVAKPFEK